MLFNVIMIGQMKYHNFKIITSHTISIIAKDKETLSLTSQPFILSISVTDANDNAPCFATMHENEMISEGAAVGVEVFKCQPQSFPNMKRYLLLLHSLVIISNIKVCVEMMLEIFSSKQQKIRIIATIRERDSYNV